ncbi:hypothetical protein NQZ68_031281 [Dissostichus eleginoides]|nr:hypothetical protein NQZ68_031281 [Dissostichus eleginoides]
MVSHKELFVESHHLVTINNTYVNWGKVLATLARAMLVIDSSANQGALHAEPWQIRVALQPPFIQGRDQHVRLDDKTDMGHNNGKAMERQFERGLLQWQRQKGSSPTATLNVTFFGEAGVDTGALRKEFLTEVVAGIEGRFFEGPQQQRIPRYSLNDFE